MSVIDKIKFKFKDQNRKAILDDQIVALDIGTEYVKALVSKVSGDEINIFGVGRTHQQLSDMHSGAIADISAVVANCSRALTIAEEMAGFRAKKAIIGIAGELVKGITHTVTYKRPDSARPIDTEEIGLIIEKAQERSEEKARAELAWETGNNEMDIKLVNSAIVAMYIDTYKVSNPIGFQGGRVTVQLYSAFAPMIHIGALEKTAQELDLDLIAVAAEPFAVSRSIIGTDASSNLTAILIDIGGGTTDIAVVDDGGVQGTRMFGIGGRSFTKAIAAELNMDFIMAEKLKLHLNSPSQSTHVRSHALKALDKTIDVWISGIELALTEFKTLDHLPNRILLCGGGSSLGPLVQALNHNQWYKDLPFAHKPTIQHIKPGEVNGIYDLTERVKDHTFVTSMGLLRIGYDTMISSRKNSELSESIQRMLRN
ncbi:MAG TPA: cell division FtsA domain-containing protein [Candidatus Saccharibacteria bacterium]|jgi:cell division protein FtsA|nr:cell division FtsA domain-containing protein [Candidatus Saccharibacteria bacterium]